MVITQGGSEVKPCATVTAERHKHALLVDGDEKIEFLIGKKDNYILRKKMEIYIHFCS